MKLGSLFDGIGGFPHIAEELGITPVWASEIDPFCIKVTKQRFPDMVHLGDICKINGADIEPVDVITGGSPCQDLSVAGKRAGLEGERSGLFMEQIRIIKEMRLKTNGLYPRYCVWENVPGAFSSNKGQDFQAILEEFCKITDPEAHVPMPDKNKWKSAGVIVGNGGSLAWRIFDAQYWGVPQRRRRIYLVADFRGHSAAEILFVEQGMSGHSQESGESGKGIAAGTERSIGETSTLCFNEGQITSPKNGNNPQWGDACHCLSATDNRPPTVIIKPELYEWHGQDVRAQGMSRQICVLESNQNNAMIYENGICSTLPAAMGMGGGYVPMIAEKTYCIQGNSIDRADTAGCNGKGWTEDVCYTLNTIDRPAVYAMQRSDEFKESDVTSTQSARQYKDSTDLVGVGYIVRRLTVLECERLQGFPDNWTNIEKASDSARYKALGNSVAIPCVRFVLSRIKELIKC